MPIQILSKTGFRAEFIENPLKASPEQYLFCFQNRLKMAKNRECITKISFLPKFSQKNSQIFTVRSDKLTMRLLSIDNLSDILQMNTTSIMELVNAGKIPYKTICTNHGGNTVQFVPAEIKQWVPWGAYNSMTDEEYITEFKNDLEKEFPEELKKLREFGSQFSDPWKPKRYYLEAVPNKKLGIVYYVKYLHNGKLIPSKWTTRTNNRDVAERYAIEYRDKLLADYFERKTVKKPYIDLYMILKKYYSENSSYLQIDIKKGRIIGDEARESYNNFISNQFIPYLRKQGVKEIEEIDTPFMSRFRNYLLADKVVKGKKIPGVKPQTTKHKISHISTIFDHLLEEGYIKTNPCKSLKSIKLKKDDQKVTGCYDISGIKGIFNKRWKNELSYLLSMLMYTTNMRNREIERIQVKDLIVINKINFINIPESKSVNGERIVPLHPLVYRKITAYVKKNKKGSEDFIFRNPGTKKLCSRVYNRAYTEMGKHLGYTKERLEQENMRFYSGRHFWKTFMNANDLGEVEEYFMGHKETNDVAKRYNHRDRQGREKIVTKAKEVFKILDKGLFV